MPALTWDRWNRSKGCRYGMDQKSFAGKSFSSIFWSAMRLVFYDEHDKSGLLYQGKIYPFAQDVIAFNGRRYRFTEQDEVAMLKLGNFHYLSTLLFATLLFEGPDQEDRGNLWAKAPIGGSKVDVNFYDIMDTALNGIGLGLTFPQNEVGLRMLTYFTGAIVLHEIMHNHFFEHPKDVDWNHGSDYASSLPHVALLAVLRASPEWSLFAPSFGSGSPRGGYMCCGTKPPPPAPITRQSAWFWCKKCEGMFFGGFPGSSGTCPAGGGHDRSASGNYSLTINSPDDTGQHYWRWCNKCQGLFFAGHGAGTCPSGGAHDQHGSGDYSLTQNVGASVGQNNWRWCNKCQGLFFAGHGAGVCPAPSRVRGAGHDKTGSGDYCVPVVVIA